MLAVMLVLLMWLIAIPTRIAVFLLSMSSCQPYQTLFLLFISLEFSRYCLFIVTVANYVTQIWQNQSWEKLFTKILYKSLHNQLQNYLLRFEKPTLYNHNWKSYFINKYNFPLKPFVWNRRHSYIFQFQISTYLLYRNKFCWKDYVNHVLLTTAEVSVCCIEFIIEVTLQHVAMETREHVKKQVSQLILVYAATAVLEYSIFSKMQFSVANYFISTQ